MLWRSSTGRLSHEGREEVPLSPRPSMSPLCPRPLRALSPPTTRLALFVDGKAASQDRCDIRTDSRAKEARRGLCIARGLCGPKGFEVPSSEEQLSRDASLADALLDVTG